MMSKKGFTLIELLVVIVIIGILVAIALPNFIKIKDKAKEAEVKQNLHAVQLALERYAVDEGDSNYPFQPMGGDWTDSYTVWQSWVDQQGLVLAGQVNPQKATNWQPAPQQRGDSLIMESYMSSYPQNPFNKKGGQTLLPQIVHYPWTTPLLRRYVGGRESNKMYEVFGPTNKYPSAWQVINGDFFVHHPFNNPPYNETGDITKTPGGSTPWRSPSGNKVLIGNFSYYPRNSSEISFPYNAIGGGAIIGYTLAGYGALRTGGQDVYNRNGEYKGRFRTTNCNLQCNGIQIGGEIPCLCGTSAPPSLTRNDGGSDTIIDSVVITLDSGVDKSTKATNADSTEGV